MSTKGNLVAAFLALKNFLPGFEARRCGSIIDTPDDTARAHGGPQSRFGADRSVREIDSLILGSKAPILALP